MSNEFQEKIKLQQQISLIEDSARRFLDKKAFERYGNLKTAYPQKAIQVASLIFQAAQTGQINKALTDHEFKELLINLQEPNREFKFIRK